MNGNIQASPVFDGTRIWFAHTTAEDNGPSTTVRWGYISTTDNTLSLALARHDATSADFNPSIGVGLGTGGVETIFLNWATTDRSQGINLSPTVATLAYNGGPLTSVIGADQILIMGGGPPFDDVWFSSWSSVAIDPMVATGTCAVISQDYYGQIPPVDNNDRSRVARVCGPVNATVPNAAGSTVPAAQAALRAASLAGDNQVTTTSCAAPSNHLVVGTSPAAGQMTQIGSEVTLIVCDLDLTVPWVIGYDDASARRAITAAGFTVGSVVSVSNCDYFKGDVADQDPWGNALTLRGTPVNLQEASGKDSRGKPCVIA
jgi:hypothetical protein